jgi:sec-independent protein translocase protein TatC
MADEPEHDPFGQTRMTLGEHLEELRKRLLRGLLALAVAFVVAWVFQEPIARIALEPYHRSVEMLNAYWTEQTEALLAENPEIPRSRHFTADGELRATLDTRPQMTGPGEGFFFVVKICLYFAVFLGAPFLLWQLWQFVAAGLYPKERGAVTRYFPASVALFLVGVLFGYFAMVPFAMYYLNRSVPLELARPDFKLEEYFTFLSSLCLALGAVFQLPLLMSFLAATGLVGSAPMRKYRGHFVVGALIVGAILTPPDPFTQILMAGPMIVLYELGIWCARAAERRRNRSATGVSTSEGRA